MPCDNVLILIYWLIGCLQNIIVMLILVACCIRYCNRTKTNALCQLCGVYM